MGRGLAETIAARLHASGVDRLFGLPGGGPNLDLIGAAAERNIDFVLTHTETASAIMAGSYGLVSGSVGAALCTRGPGLSSAVNGLAQATLDRFPLVLFADTVPASQRARVPHQRLDQVALTAAATKWSATVGQGDADATVDAALRLARTLPAGAVHLDVDPTGSSTPPPPSPPPDVVQSEPDLGTFRKPVLIVGHLADPAEVRRLTGSLNAPVLVTYHAMGFVPAGSPQFAGLFTNGASERALLDQADLIVAVGVDPNEPIPAAWPYQAPLLTVGPGADPHPYFPSHWHTSAIPHALLDGPDTAWDTDEGRRYRQRTWAALMDGGACDGLHPGDLVATAAKVLPHATACVDAGAHFFYAVPGWNAQEPYRLLISNGLATMGFALPAAIGAALARPNEPVLCFVGDGGLGIVLAELETVARLQLDITIVVFDDAMLSLIAIKQGESHGGAGAVRFAPVDFAAVAGGFGLPAATVETTAELRAALRGAGPKLIDARVDSSVYSHALRVTRG